MEPLSKKVGYYYEHVKITGKPPTNKPWYLNELTLTTAHEIDNYLFGEQEDFSSLKELSWLIGDNNEDSYKIKTTDSLFDIDFPYLEFWEVIREKFDKDERELRYKEELALEVNLLYLELSNLPKLLPQKTLEEIPKESREERIKRRYEGIKHEVSEEEFEKNSGKLEDMITFLCRLSKHLSILNYEQIRRPHQLAA